MTRRADPETSQTDTGGVSLGRPFAWLWAAYAISTAGTWLAFDAFPLIAILALHAGPAAVAALAAVGPMAGALLAVPLGPWIEFHRKRPVMVAMDLARSAILLTVPIAYGLGALTIAQLLVVSVLVAMADIAFRAASGAHLKAVVARRHLLTANARLEATQWTAVSIGPPLGGLAIGLLGPVVTVVADAVSFLGSALTIRAIRSPEPVPTPAPVTQRRVELLAGWRYIAAHSELRALFTNTIAVNALIMATAPLVAVLMLGRLGFAPWQYGLAFGAPCVGGLLGARISRRVVARHGRERVIRVAGTLRVCWSIGLAFIPAGVGGVLLVVALQLGIVTSMGVYNPVLATHRLAGTDDAYLARVLAAWTLTGRAAIALLTALGGLLATVTGPRVAIAIAGGLLLATPLLLPRSRAARRAAPGPAVSAER